MPETQRIEYKREINNTLDLEKEVIAFLNSQEGGIIYIGIAKSGQTIGVADSDADMLKIKDRIRTNISPIWYDRKRLLHPGWHCCRTHAPGYD